MKPGLRSKHAALALLACASLAAGSARADRAAFRKAWEAGQDAFNLGRYDEARAQFERARKLAPKLPGPYRWLGRIARVQERWDDCIARSTTAVRMRPDSPLLPQVRADIDACRAALGRPAYPHALAAGQGALAVIVDVEGAAVTVDSITKGKTPLAPMPLNKGRHVVEARLDGPHAASARVAVDVVPGIVVDAVLTLAPPPAKKP